MVKRRGRGTPEGLGVQKKVTEITIGGLDIPDNPSNVLGMDPRFEEANTADTVMPKKRRRGLSIGSSVEKKVKKITKCGLDIPCNPTAVLEMNPDTCMPQKRGRGRPKGSSVQNKVQQITNGGLDFHDNRSNMLEVDPGFEVVHEAGDTTISATSDIEVNLSELYSPLPSGLRNILIPFLVSNPSMLLSTHPGHRGPAYMVLGEFLLFVANHSMWTLANDQRSKFMSLLNALSDFSFDAAWLEKVKCQIVSPSEDSPLHAISLVSAAKDCARVEVERLSAEAAYLSKALEETKLALCECMAKATALEEEESCLLSHLDAPLKF